MHPMSPGPAMARAPGFTLIEALVAMAILAVLLGLGMPRMSDWLAASKAGAASQFYAEGFALARAQALTHNSASRLVLATNPASGQPDWRVDICFPTTSVPCSDVSGAWSSTAAAAAGDPQGAAGFVSVLRHADALPGTSVLSVQPAPADAASVYFTPLGWVDTGVSPRLARIDLAPAAGRSGAFPAAAVVLTLAGLASKCNPNAAAHDARGCPP